MIKKLYKKGLSALLTLCLLFSFLPVMSVHAASYTVDDLKIGDSISAGDVISKGTATIHGDYHYYDKADATGQQKTVSIPDDPYTVESFWGINEWKVYDKNALGYKNNFYLVPAKEIQKYTATPKYCTVGGSSEPREYAVGDPVTVETREVSGATFTGWASEPDGVDFVKTGEYQAEFVMPGNDVTIYAVFKNNPEPSTEYTVAVKGGTADKDKCGEDEKVTVTADKPAEGYRFTKWTTESEGVNFEDPSKAETSFMMPAHDVSVTAEFEPIPAPVPTYPVTVEGGTADKTAYAAGETVKITAPDELAGGRFDNWSTDSKDVTFADAKAAITTFTMPAGDVTVKAVFEKTVTNPVTGLPMSGGETGAFALITLSVLLLGTTVLKRKADR